MSARPALFDPDSPPPPAPMPFGMVPTGLGSWRWEGPKGPEKFTHGDFRVWPELARMLAVDGRLTSVADLAGRAGVGKSAAYHFLHRLERSGLATLHRNDSDWIVGVELRYRTGYHEAAYRELDKERQKRAPRYTLPASLPPESARPGGRKRAPRRAQPSTPVEPSLLEFEKGEEFESGDPIRSLALGEDADPVPTPTPDPAPPAPPAAPVSVPAAPPAASPDPTPEQVAEWERQAADARPGASVRVHAQLARLALRSWREELAARAAAAAPVVAPVAAPSPPAPAPAPILTPTMVRRPAPDPSPPVDFETMLRRVANREHFGDETVDQAAEQLAGILRDPCGVPGFRKVLGEVRAGILRGRDVLGALRCSRGPEVHSRGAVFTWALGRSRAAGAQKPAHAPP